MSETHPSVRRLLLPITTTQWSAIEAANDVWMATESGVSAALLDYPPSRRRAYRHLLSAAEWQRTCPQDPRLAAVTGNDFTILMALGDEVVYWTEQGDGLWLPGIPGVLPVEEDTHGQAAVDPGFTDPYFASSGLLWLGFDTAATRRRGGNCIELRLWEDAVTAFAPLEH
ncbi:hypothetical protein F8S09_06635 [Deinococcus sp. SDU3-2]|uniref:Uncharacterized protein n=1 Tax=Deinococcus terrestris TaxID=2651870 RepID=A0A7X1NV59_9DEIO|nr:hypothetical protein [Deinococcus terrestris]MPY66376.1 hypothetical protein [Deinococcus terrestris]